MGWGQSYNGYFTCPECSKKFPDSYRTSFTRFGENYKPRVDPYCQGVAKANFYRHVRACQARKENTHAHNS